MPSPSLSFRALLESAYNETPQTRDHCNYLIYAVAKRLGIRLPSGLTADGLVDHMSKFWFTIGSVTEAEQRASHQFVVAGLKSTAHIPPRLNGHVAILIPRTTQEEHSKLGVKWPYAWSAGVQSTGNLSIGSQIWRLTDIKHVKFFTPTSIMQIRTVPAY